MPTVAASLATDLVGISWALLAYQISNIGLSINFGRVSDLWGREKIFALGFLVFSVSALLCGMSLNVTQLIASRFVQGVGGAMLQSSSRALAAESVPEELAGRAQGYMTTAHHVGFILGPSIGGFMIDYLSWRWSFFLLVPIGLCGTLLSLAGLKRRPSADRPDVSIDYLGAALLIATTTGYQTRAFGAAAERLRLREAALLGLELPQRDERSDHLGVLGPEGLLADGERPAAAQLGVGVAALQALERGKRVEGSRDFGVLRPQHALVDGEGTTEQRLGRRVLALGLVGGGEQAQAERDARVLGPEALGPLERGREEALGLGVAALLVGPVARGHRCLPSLAVGGGLGGDRRRTQSQRDHGEGGRTAGGEAGEAVDRDRQPDCRGGHAEAARVERQHRHEGTEAELVDGDEHAHPDEDADARGLSHESLGVSRNAVERKPAEAYDRAQHTKRRPSWRPARQRDSRYSQA